LGGERNAATNSLRGTTSNAAAGGMRKDAEEVIEIGDD
jgi:hypothetical protein